MVVLSVSKWPLWMSRSMKALYLRKGIIVGGIYLVVTEYLTNHHFTDGGLFVLVGAGLHRQCACVIGDHGVTKKECRGLRGPGGLPGYLAARN